MSHTHIIYSAVNLFLVDGLVPTHFTPGIFYIVGSLLFTIGTVLRRGSMWHGNASNSRSQKLWAQSMQLDTTRKSAEGVANAAPRRQHANAM